MGDFVQRRHQAPREGGASELVLACPSLRSQVNLARIVRVAGCCGVREMIVAGSGKIDAKIARDALEAVTIHRHRTLLPVLRKWRDRGYSLVGLEQTTGSVCLSSYSFPRRCVLVIGHERLGIEPEILSELEATVEIPVFGRPASYNVATATAIALYEYCRQAG